MRIILFICLMLVGGCGISEPFMWKEAIRVCGVNSGVKLVSHDGFFGIMIVKCNNGAEFAISYHEIENK